MPYLRCFDAEQPSQDTPLLPDSEFAIAYEAPPATVQPSQLYAGIDV